MEGAYVFKIVHSKLMQSLQSSELSGSKRYLHNHEKRYLVRIGPKGQKNIKSQFWFPQFFQKLNIAHYPE